jgi:hypothetical protein
MTDLKKSHWFYCDSKLNSFDCYDYYITTFGLGDTAMNSHYYASMREALEAVSRYLESGEYDFEQVSGPCEQFKRAVLKLVKGY